MHIYGINCNKNAYIGYKYNNDAYVGNIDKIKIHT